MFTGTTTVPPGSALQRGRQAQGRVGASDAGIVRAVWRDRDLRLRRAGQEGVHQGHVGGIGVAVLLRSPMRAGSASG